MANDHTLQLAKKAVERGITYLTGAQLSDGSFPGQSAPSKTNFDGTVATRTTFNTSTIATILGGMAHADVRLQRACVAASNFLISQKSARGSWNYWHVGTRRSNLPDDLDDTFCALAAIQLADPGAITPRVMSKTVALLVSAEELPGGPYRTWLVDGHADPQWRDVDLAVNCNIAYFLQLRGIRAHALEAYISEQVRDGSIGSRYYPDALTVVYLLSRLSFVDKSLIEPTSAHDPVAAAMALAISPKSSQAAAWAEKVLSGAGADGSWPAVGFCLDPAASGVQWYAGSHALSTAICTHALHVWFAAQQPALPLPPQPAVYRGYASVKVSNELRRFGASWQELGAQYLQKLESQSDEITSIHVRFAEALGLLGAASDLRDGSPFMVDLAFASLCGWMAFTMYDDVVDGDAAPSLLLLANHFFCTFNKTYAAEFPPTSDFSRFRSGILLKATHASMYEVTRCRTTCAQFPQLMGSLRIADRSAGHALSCAAVLFRARDLGCISTLHALGSTMKFFACYLSARQLHDDGHDWQRDLGRGTVNPVAADLMSALNVRQAGKADVARMEAEFREFGLARLCREICSRVAEARAVADAEPAFKNKDFFYGLVDPLRRSAEHATLEVAQAKEFMLAYSGDV